MSVAGTIEIENAKHHKAFEVWYAKDRNYRNASRELTAVCTLATIYRWAQKYDWETRADNRDSQAARLLEQESVGRRAAMISEQRKAGKLLRQLGLQYLVANLETVIANPKDAINAIKEGLALERQAEGLPDWVGTIVNATSQELMDDYQRLLKEIAATAEAESHGTRNGASRNGHSPASGDSEADPEGLDSGQDS